MGRQSPPYHESKLSGWCRPPKGPNRAQSGAWLLQRGFLCYLQRLLKNSASPTFGLRKSPKAETPLTRGQPDAQMSLSPDSHPFAILFNEEAKCQVFQDVFFQKAEPESFRKQMCVISVIFFFFFLHKSHSINHGRSVCPAQLSV